MGNRIDADRIAWIMPRDPWILNRAVFDGYKFLTIDKIVEVMDISCNAKTVDEYYHGLERVGFCQRIDTLANPTKNKCATVSPEEISKLRLVKNVIRLGRVKKIESRQIVLEKGRFVIKDDSMLFVDCSTDGLVPRPSVPIFNGDRITLQSVRTCQQVFSAALIAHVEGYLDSDEQKNAMCTPVPHPDAKEDFLKTQVLTKQNAAAWAKDPQMTRWLKASRLNGLDKPVIMSKWETFLFFGKNLHRIRAILGLPAAEKRAEAHLRRLMHRGHGITNAPVAKL